MFKTYAAIAVILSVLGGAAWHKHVVTQRNDAWAQVRNLGERLKLSDAAARASEANRKTEHTAAVSALADAGKACDARVAEARRSAGAIKTIVEKPHAVDPASHCPVPDLVPARELRDALQPHPFGRA